jgi:hypothetical protein
MALKNFRFFAMRYLKDWWAGDRRFVTGLLPSPRRAERRTCLRDAATYYKVIRNFKRIKGEERLDGALTALDEVSQPITDDTVDSAVEGLATALQSIYGMNVISAASKFLWLRHQSPVVIYDDRAIQCLRSCGCHFGQCDYSGYRREWRRQFFGQEPAIREACADLPRVKEFALPHPTPDKEFGNLIGCRWFHERIFDTFLWWNSRGNEVATST